MKFNYKNFILIITSIIFGFVIPGMIHAYYYPWLYNIINNFTERSEPLEEHIDLFNSILVFVLSWIITLLLMIIINFLKKNI